MFIYSTFILLLVILFADVLRTQRNINSPIQSSSVVSVSGLSPVHLQAGAQRLLVTTGTPGQAKTIVGGTSGTIAGKTINPVHLQMVRQTTLKQQQQLRLQSSITSQAVKATPIPIGGQQTVQVQLTQAQPRAQVSVSRLVYFCVYISPTQPFPYY